MPGRTPRDERERRGGAAHPTCGSAVKDSERQVRGAPRERGQSQGSRGRTEHRHSLLGFSSPAGPPFLWDKKTEGIGERGPSPTQLPATGSLAGKATQPLLPLFHKSRLLTREDQIVAVK